MAFAGLSKIRGQSNKEDTARESQKEWAVGETPEELVSQKPSKEGVKEGRVVRTTRANTRES